MTVDGWVIIGLCMLLLFMSMAIMIVEAAVPESRGEGQRASSSDEFRKLRDDVTLLEPRDGSDKEDSAFETGTESQLMSTLGAKGERFGISTLFRLYHHGVREVRQRLEGQAAGADRARVLSPQSIEAIRATMDASLTRMTQRLSSQMVLLTIAISGGPFLGLLGTVVGVMITFAAIAASRRRQRQRDRARHRGRAGRDGGRPRRRDPVPVRLQLSEHAHQGNRRGHARVRRRVRDAHRRNLLLRSAHVRARRR